MGRNPLEEIEALQEQSEKPRCKVQLALRWIDAELKSGLEEALANQAVNSAAIAKWLRREGFQISDRAVQRHRGGSCCGYTQA